MHYQLTWSSSRKSCFFMMNDTSQTLTYFQMNNNLLLSPQADVSLTPPVILPSLATVRGARVSMTDVAIESGSLSIYQEQ